MKLSQRINETTIPVDDPAYFGSLRLREVEGITIIYFFIKSVLKKKKIFDSERVTANHVLYRIRTLGP